MERLHVSTNIETEPVMRALHVALTGRVFKRGAGWKHMDTEWVYPVSERTMRTRIERDGCIHVRLKRNKKQYKVRTSDIEEGVGELLREYPRLFASLMKSAVRRWVDNPAYFKACTLLLEFTVYGYAMSEDMAEGE
jgi:hypothetical protein